MRKTANRKRPHQSFSSKARVWRISAHPSIRKTATRVLLNLGRRSASQWAAQTSTLRKVGMTRLARVEIRTIMTMISHTHLSQTRPEIVYWIRRWRWTDYWHMGKRRKSLGRLRPQLKGTTTQTASSCQYKEPSIIEWTRLTWERRPQWPG